MLDLIDLGTGFWRGRGLRFTIASFVMLVTCGRWSLFRLCTQGIEVTT